ILFCILLSCINSNQKKINRYELVNRHNIVINEINPYNSLTVGNGNFAYTVDITGMQSFPEFYEEGISLGTQSQWGWHPFPNTGDYCLKDVMKNFAVGTDSVPYAYQYTGNAEDRKVKATNWLRENPHKLHLGIVGLEIEKNNSAIFSVNDIQNPVQKLNLWTGEIRSFFEIDGIPVELFTYCHQELDMISVKIKTELIKHGQLKIKIRFPYASSDKFSSGYDFSKPTFHESCVIDSTDKQVVFERLLDDYKYYACFTWKQDAELIKMKNHEYFIVPVKRNSCFEFNFLFSDRIPEIKLPGYKKTVKNNKQHWKKFWEGGGAVDFSECTDLRAFELERRIVLSQYLTKIQCTGSLPPQETGLTTNSWHGKFHLEMHWWHAMHFLLWQRAELIEHQIDYYFSIFDKAKKTAQNQGYEGVRWPKMIAPDGRESPSNIGTFLIWQQPHIIYFAEKLYQYYNLDKAVLKKYKNLVFSTAAFMASYARFDSVKNKYILGPALIPAQECFSPETTINPSFELVYWYWGLKTAQRWKNRLGETENKKWQDVIDNISDLPIQDSLYLFTENVKNSYINTEYLKDHPIVLGTLGFLPLTEKIDTAILKNTLHKIIEKWDWNTTWGWDFPLAAMNAACLNEPELAIDLLMMDTDKNLYLLNGHNYQDDKLGLYLPGNGALLTAVALMCTHINTWGYNGFPRNGDWNVKFENLNKLH
ncbi:MAG: hypothetical protein JXJ22_12910, partial [Bacteroidales bacterium]|nr:hypothetical protein [Bacteroidales bacterium]